MDGVSCQLKLFIISQVSTYLKVSISQLKLMDLAQIYIMSNLSLRRSISGVRVWVTKLNSTIFEYSNLVKLRLIPSNFRSLALALLLHAGAKRMQTTFPPHSEPSQATNLPITHSDVITSLASSPPFWGTLNFRRAFLNVNFQIHETKIFCKFLKQRLPCDLSVKDFAPAFQHFGSSF